MWMPGQPPKYSLSKGIVLLLVAFHVIVKPHYPQSLIPAHYFRPFCFLKAQLRSKVLQEAIPQPWASEIPAPSVTPLHPRPGWFLPSFKLSSGTPRPQAAKGFQRHLVPFPLGLLLPVFLPQLVSSTPQGMPVMFIAVSLASSADPSTRRY